MRSWEVPWAVNCSKIEALEDFWDPKSRPWGTFGLHNEVLGGQLERLSVVMGLRMTNVSYFGVPMAQTSKNLNFLRFSGGAEVPGPGEGNELVPGV